MRTHAPKCTFDTKEADTIFSCTCDGYHTFDELYEHRVTLYIALCSVLAQAKEYGKEVAEKTNGNVFADPDVFRIWRSKKHSDGEVCFGTGTQFVMGIGKNIGEQITYHIPINRWEETEFAETLEIAPPFDGHTSDDVLNRLKTL